MTIGRFDETPTRRFKPNPKIKGGSQKGKAQGYWPWIMKVVADAVVVRHHGTNEGAQRNRRWLTQREFNHQLNVLMPGWMAEASRILGPRKTALDKLLRNRTYKGLGYSGTSDRGKKHDPETRATESRERWTKHLGVNHPARAVHDRILRGGDVPDWQQHYSWGNSRGKPVPLS